MTFFLGLARQAVAEVERRAAAAGLDVLVTMSAEAFSQRIRAEIREQVEAEVRASVAERDRRHEQAEQAFEERVQRLESTLAGQDAGLAEVREQIRSLVTQLNERLLPVIDERMDETERDLARLATGMMRNDKKGNARESRLDTAERRLADLRDRVARMEQRVVLWRDLQAATAKLGDDVDTLRTRLGQGINEAQPLAEPQPVQARVGER